MSSSISPPSRPGSNLDQSDKVSVSNQLKSQDHKNNNNSNNNQNGGQGAQQFCLRWNNYQSNLTSVFDQLLQSESFVDVTLACDGHSIKAHKMVLSACSPYFQTLFFDNPCQHPIIIMRDVKWPELKAVVEFMYKGEINVSQDQIGPLLKVAEMLKIRGLAEVNSEEGLSAASNVTESTSIIDDPPLDVSAPKKPRSKDWDSEIPLSTTPKSRKRRWPSGERSSSVGSLVDCVPEVDVPSPLPPPTNLSHSHSSATPTPIPQNFPLPPQIDPMVLGPLGLPNHPEEMEIKPGIAEMIREEERVSTYFFTIFYSPPFNELSLIFDKGVESQCDRA